MGILGRVLGTLSGGTQEVLSEQLLFDKVIGFRGIKDGVGCSTFVANIAMGLQERTKYNICVVDTNILYPSQEYILGSLTPDEIDEPKDLMDFAGENLSEVAYKTRYANIYLVSFRNRVLADMLSSKECEYTVTSLLDALKAYFDVVLIDLSHEPTWATTIAAIKCNRIYDIVEPSVACLSVLQKSLNSLISTGVPLYKCRKIILNKNIVDVNTGIYKTLKALNLDLLADIPFSVDIARYGVSNEPLWGSSTNRQAITRYNQALEIIIDDICERNDLNQKAMRLDSELQELETYEIPDGGKSLSETKPKGKRATKPIDDMPDFDSEVSKPSNVPQNREESNSVVNTPNRPMASQSGGMRLQKPMRKVGQKSTPQKMGVPKPKIQKPVQPQEDDEIDLFGDD